MIWFQTKHEQILFAAGRPRWFRSATAVVMEALARGFVHVFFFLRPLRPLRLLCSFGRSRSHGSQVAVAGPECAPTT